MKAEELTIDFWKIMKSRSLHCYYYYRLVLRKSMADTSETLLNETLHFLDSQKTVNIVKFFFSISKMEPCILSFLIIFWKSKTSKEKSKGFDLINRYNTCVSRRDSLFFTIFYDNWLCVCMYYVSVCLCMYVHIYVCV